MTRGNREDDQLDFGFRTPPRRRKKRLGRPPKRGSGVPHLPRSVHARHPLHVTPRPARGVAAPQPALFRSARARFPHRLRALDTRVAHFSVRHNHVHLLVETQDARALARAIQGIAIRMAKGLNRVMHRKGTVFADRYHSRPLRTPTEVRRALVYVLCNGRKHLARLGHRLSPGWMDEYASGAWFTGWNVPPRAPAGEAPGGAPPHTWLLSSGWLERGGGPIRRDEMPVDG